MLHGEQQVQSGRRVVPTALGITLVRGYQYIDVDLCLPDIRSFIEQQITLIAKGLADHAAVVQHSLQEFSAKFKYFVSQVRKTCLYALSFTQLPSRIKEAETVEQDQKVACEMLIP